MGAGYPSNNLLYNALDRAGEALASLVVKEFGIISQANISTVVERHKFREEQDTEISDPKEGGGSVQYSLLHIP